MNSIPKQQFLYFLLFSFSITISFIYTLILPASELQTQQLITSQIRSHIKYLLQAYNILMLILYSKIYDKIYSPSNSFWYDFMMMLDIGLLLGHPVLNCTCLHNCLSWNKSLNNALNKKNNQSHCIHVRKPIGNYSSPATSCMCTCTESQ